MRHEVVSNQALNYKFRLLTLRAKNPEFTFKTGQFVILKVTDAIFRCYSIASTPQELPLWQIFVDITPNGPGTQYLGRLKPQDEIETTKVSGLFTAQKDNSRQIIFAATGCGLAALKPMIEELLRKKSGPQVMLYWGLRYQKDIVFQNLLARWQKHPNFSVEIVLSQPEGSWPGKKGHLTPYLTEEVGSSSKKTSVYLCGGGDFIEEAQKALQAVKFPANRIYFEKCY